MRMPLPRLRRTTSTSSRSNSERQLNAEFSRIVGRLASRGSSRSRQLRCKADPDRSSSSPSCNSPSGLLYSRKGLPSTTQVRIGAPYVRLRSAGLTGGKPYRRNCSRSRSDHSWPAAGRSAIVRPQACADSTTLPVRQGTMRSLRSPAQAGHRNATANATQRATSSDTPGDMALTESKLQVPLGANTDPVQRARRRCLPDQWFAALITAHLSGASTPEFVVLKIRGLECATAVAIWVNPTLREYLREALRYVKQFFADFHSFSDARTATSLCDVATRPAMCPWPTVCGAPALRL